MNIATLRRAIKLFCIDCTGSRGKGECDPLITNHYKHPGEKWQCPFFGIVGRKSSKSKLLKSIREHCNYCCVGSITLCTSPNCPIFAFRDGCQNTPQ